MNMKVDLCGVTLNNPVMTASGTFGSGAEYAEFVDLNKLGAVVTKGVADLSAIHRVRGSRCKCAAARLWKYTLERRKGSSGREWIYWHFYGRI